MTSLRRPPAHAARCPITPSIRQQGVLVVLLLCVLLPASAASAASVAQAFDAKVSATLAQIGESLCGQFGKLAGALSRERYLKIEIESCFYDPHLRRVFVAFKGSGLFAGKLPVTIPPEGYMATCDGAIAYDLALTEPRTTADGVAFGIKGTGVVFLERVILDLSSKLVFAAGVPVAQETASTLLRLVNGIDCEVLAGGLNQLFASFSPASLQELGKKLTTTSKGGPIFAKEVAAAVARGGPLDFLRLSLVNQSLGTLAGTVGGTLGAVVGTALLGPVGSVTGLLVGGYVVSSLAQYTLYKFTVEIPINRGLQHIVAAVAAAWGNPQAQSAREAAGTGMAMVLTPIRAEFERKQFQAFDYTLGRIDLIKPDNRPALVELLRQLQKDVLRKITVDADWYFAKKYYQMKEKVEQWGLQDQVVFTATPPKDGRPRRQ